MDWINKLHSICDEEFVAAAASAVRTPRLSSSRQQQQQPSQTRANAGESSLSRAADAPESAAPNGASGAHGSISDTRKRKRDDDVLRPSSASPLGQQVLPLNAVHIDILRLVLTRCVEGGVLSATSLPPEYMDRVKTISSLSEVHKRKKYLGILEELTSMELQQRISACSEADLTAVVLQQDGHGWSMDASAQQAFLCPLMLALAADAYAVAGQRTTGGTSGETRELEGLLDGTRIALAEAECGAKSLKQRTDSTVVETRTAVMYLQSLLKRIELELLQIL